MMLPAIISALGLPDSAMVNQRVPKKMLVENGAPTAADRRRINDGIEEIHWLAALKPNTIGVPEYRDDVREYLEIALLSVSLRPEAKAGRLSELIHRAIPYPLFLLLSQGDQAILSLSHKRKAQNEEGKFVLDGDGVEVMVSDHTSLSAAVSSQFLDAMALRNQPRGNMFQLYQGWVDALVALQVAHITGKFILTNAREAAIARRKALQDYRELEARIASLRGIAAKEKQIARRVELNLEIKGIEVVLREAAGKL